MKIAVIHLFSVNTTLVDVSHCFRLQIAKLLLNNTNTWIHGEERIVGRRREVHQTPILVICFTNHALDQFLEGIYDFYGHNENKIVRIGGRSKSEKLEDCNLRAIKEKGDKKAPRYVREGIGKVYSRLKGVRSKYTGLKSMFYGLIITWRFVRKIFLRLRLAPRVE